MRCNAFDAKKKTIEKKKKTNAKLRIHHLNCEMIRMNCLLMLIFENLTVTTYTHLVGIVWIVLFWNVFIEISTKKKPNSFRTALFFPIPISDWYLHESM